MSAHRDHRNGDKRLQDSLHSVEINLTAEQIAAVEGWRAANRIGSQTEAVRELVRIGLLSEIGRVYRLFSNGADEMDGLFEGQRDISA